MDEGANQWPVAVGYQVDFQETRWGAVPFVVNGNWNFAPHGVSPSSPPPGDRGRPNGLQQPIPGGLTGAKQTVAYFMVELQVPAALLGFHQIGQRLPPLASDAVGNLPNHHDRFPNSIIADASACQRSGFAAFLGGVLQRTNAMLAVMASDSDEFVEDPAFILLGCLLVSVPDRGQEFLLLHPGDSSTHVVTTRLLGNMLIEATTFVE